MADLAAKKSGIRLSVIIPHYNSTDGMLRMLESIPDEPWIEVLVVDDRSTVDLSSLQAYVQKRGERVQLLRNDHENKGAGTARNIGLSCAKGEWLMFGDADDYFVEGWEKIAEGYLDCNADEIFFPPTSYNIAAKTTGARHRHYEELVLSYAGHPSQRTQTELRYGFYTPWSKMVRRSVFTENDIRFDEQLVANDIMAMTKAAYYSASIAVDTRAVYCVTCGEKTLTSKKNEANFDTRIDTKIRRYHFLREHLSGREFNQTHFDYYMAGSLADAAFGKWGMRKLVQVLGKYRRNKIRWMSIYMFEPSFLFHYIWLDVKWRMETNG